MRKLIVSEFVSLDGVMENPQWTFQFGSQEQERFKLDELMAADGLLVGRVTYEGFAAAWPNMQGTGVYGERMNSFPKYVVSTTLQQGSWTNTRVLRENVAEEIARLKQEPGQDIVVFGSGTLVQWLHQQDLIDEYRLMVFPIVLGSGQRLFEGSEQKVLRLVESKTFASGVVVLTYQPARQS